MDSTQKGTSQIHHDWSKIEEAIACLSSKTLDDCVKRLNESVFSQLPVSKSANVDEIKAEISLETFDKIMNEIDDDVKTQHIVKENKDKQKPQYVGKEMRQFISKPVIYIFVPFS